MVAVPLPPVDFRKPTPKVIVGLPSGSVVLIPGKVMVPSLAATIRLSVKVAASGGDVGVTTGPVVLKLLREKLTGFQAELTGSSVMSPAATAWKPTRRALLVNAPTVTEPTLPLNTLKLVSETVPVTVTVPMPVLPAPALPITVKRLSSTEPARLAAGLPLTFS